MQREHEEAMRADFDRYVDLSDQKTYGLIQREDPITAEQLDAIATEREIIADRWREGPHAEHWGYLDDAHHDWREAPDTMRRMREDIAHNGGFGVTEIQTRSLDQAATLVARSNERTATWQAEARAQRDATAGARTGKRARSGVERSR